MTNPHLAVTARLVAIIAALAAVAPAMYGVAIVAIGIGASAQHPDPRVPDGDPCCGHPDTWSEVVAGLLYSVTLAVAVAALLWIAGMVGRFGITGRKPSRRALRHALAASAYIAVWLLIALVIAAA